MTEACLAHLLALPRLDLLDLARCAAVPVRSMRRLAEHFGLAVQPDGPRTLARTSTLAAGAYLGHR